MSAHGAPEGAVPAYEERLRAFAGRELTPRTRAQDPVNQPMIRHWTEAMGDTDPVHTDAAAARATGRADVTAPASMVQAWTMRGYAASQGTTAVRTGFTELVGLLAEGGYTSVVATDSELEFVRELHPGDHIEVREVCESVSEEKRTALGTGRFVTTVKTYSDQHGESVATQRWRTLRFRPAEREEPSEREEPRAGEGEREEKQRAPRPRPAINRDNAFWFEAAREHRLVVQRCAACATLRHPPGPCCPECGALEWDTVEASGHGHVHTFVVNHHPPHPAFDTPYIVAVVELAESTRLITNLTGIAPGDVRIGMPVVLEWLDADTGARAGTRTAAPGSPLTLPVFRPAAATEER